MTTNYIKRFSRSWGDVSACKSTCRSRMRALVQILSINVQRPCPQRCTGPGNRKITQPRVSEILTQGRRQRVTEQGACCRKSLHLQSSCDHLPQIVTISLVNVHHRPEDRDSISPQLRFPLLTPSALSPTCNSAPNLVVLGGLSAYRRGKVP